MTLGDEIEALITRTPGLTGPEIATILFGDAASHLPQVTTACLRLLRGKRIDRSGRGGRSDPFRYFSKGVLAAPTPLTKLRRSYSTKFR
jgi:hypothetical protein